MRSESVSDSLSLCHVPQGYFNCGTSFGDFELITQRVQSFLALQVGGQGFNRLINWQLVCTDADLHNTT